MPGFLKLSSITALLFLFILTCFPVDALAGNYAVFGQDFHRTSGSPVTETGSFTVDNPNSTYTLQIYNGTMEDSEVEFVSSSTISINGTQIVGPSEFNQNTTYIEKEVSLNSSNELSVKLRGKPGAGITLLIVGVDNDLPSIEASLSAEPNGAGWHNQDVIVSFTCSDSTSGVTSCSSPVTISTEGAGQVITGTATDVAGNTATASVTINLDKTAPGISVTSPTDGAVLADSPIEVTGTIDDNTASVSVNGASATVTAGSFTTSGIALVDGSNTITIAATDDAGNESTTLVAVTYQSDSTAPVVSIDAPADGSTVASGPVTVSGTVDDDSATVDVNGISATVSAGAFTATGVTLAEGANTITATATDVAGNSSSALVSVSLDSTAPVVSIDSPSHGSAFASGPITVTGSIDDNSASVNVNGISASVSAGVFTATGIGLTEGSNTITATATDGLGNSSSATISVSLDSTAPVISITSPTDGSITTDSSVTVSGTVDDNSASITVNGVTATVSAGTFTATGVTLAEGANTITATATDGAGNSSSSSISITLDTSAPAISITSPTGGSTTTASSITVTGTVDDNSASVTVNGVTATVSAGTFTATGVALAEGANTITATATDGAGNSSASIITVTLDTSAPVISITSPTDGSTTTASSITVSGSIDDDLASLDVNGVTATVSGGTFTASGVVIYAGVNTITATATNTLGNSSSASIKVTFEGIVLPPDPALVAPPVDGTVSTNMGSATEFLYTGANAIQTGVLPGTIEATRVAVVRGTVYERDGSPLSGVDISIKDHSEFGFTATRADGMFDMAVNGGGNLVIEYKKDGYLPVHRKVDTPWQDYVWAEDIVMISLDPQVTTIDLTSGAAMEVAQGSIVTDGDGTRQATMLFPAGTTAEMVFPLGGTQQLTTLNVRATEYTVGANGPQAMPAELPPASAYTYAVELSVDEATAAGAKSVNFSSPVVVYLDNFINVEVGVNVPSGYYDPDAANWVASTDGLVVEILSITNGMADLDIDGSGVPATAAALAAKGITDAERTEVALLYSAGESFWRMPVSHFSIWDFNFPYGLVADAVLPYMPKPIVDFMMDDCWVCPGSIVKVQNQTLGESAGITGTPYSLNYQSDRVDGRIAGRKMEIQLTDDTPLPQSLMRIVLEITVAGSRYYRTFPLEPNLTHTFVWDGKDGYGRKVQGQHKAHVRIGYVYPAILMARSTAGESFGSVGGPNSSFISGDRAAREITLWQGFAGLVMGIFDAKPLGYGGWTLDVQHFYDPVSHVLQLGNGDSRGAYEVVRTIETIVGRSSYPPQPGDYGYNGDNIPAKDATLMYPEKVKIDAEGNLFIVDAKNHRIRKVDTNGIITTVAGSGGNPPGGYIADVGDGGLAINAKLHEPLDIEVAPDGTLYIADSKHFRIRKVTPDGIISTYAGTGYQAVDLLMYQNGWEFPATTVHIGRVDALALDNEGNLYFSNMLATRASYIGVITPEGIVKGYASGRAYGMVTDDEGNLYIAKRMGNGVDKVTPDGVVKRIAGFGAGAAGYNGDGHKALDTKFSDLCQIDIDSAGNIYLAETPFYYDTTAGHRIRMINTEGYVSTVAGRGEVGVSGDGGPALDARLGHPKGVAVAPNGTLYIAEALNHRIRRVSGALPGFTHNDISIPSEDGSLLYIFNMYGMHKKTLSTSTGATVFDFTYDGDGLLTAVTDGDGDVTYFNRDYLGRLTSVTAPDGQVTSFAYNGNGYFSNITNPAFESNHFTYTAKGLMKSRTDARGGLHTFTYDGDGRLIKDTNPAGGFWELSRIDDSGQFTVDLSSAEGRTSTAFTINSRDGYEWSVDTAATGLQTTFARGPKGDQTTTLPDGTIYYQKKGPDPRFDMQAPITTFMSFTTPSGLMYEEGRARAVSLANPDDPLSLVSMTNWHSYGNLHTTTTHYDAASKTITSTTPMGRVKVTTTDDLGKPLTLAKTGLETAYFGYDARGRLVNTSSGSGALERVSSLTYDTDGNVETMTDPIGRVTSFVYDPVGRVTRTTLPDLREINFSYDEHGNLTSLTPPSRPAHMFTYTVDDLTGSYTPPDVLTGNVATTYAYNLDKQPTLVTRAGGATVAFGYDSPDFVSVDGLLD
ncbi:MAG: Ig-like domain-containing protein, partial [Thermodesulfobacteriota bacterium]